MDTLTGEDLKKLVKGLISEKHQVNIDSIHLTVGNVYRLTSGGDIDFGGSEQVEAKTEEVEIVKRKPEDDYGWWNLSEGGYMVEFNEDIELSQGQLGFLQPLERSLKSGAFHPVRIITSTTEVPNKILLQVGNRGFSIKENSRLSSLTVLQ